MDDINIWAVLAAAASAMVLGAVWYSPPVFGSPWMRLSGVDPKSGGQGHPAKVYGITSLMALITAAVFAAVLGPAPSMEKALYGGLLIGLGFVATSYAVNYLFAGRSPLLLLIDGGYHVAKFVLFGLILWLIG